MCPFTIKADVATSVHAFPVFPKYRVKKTLIRQKNMRKPQIEIRVEDFSPLKSGELKQLIRARRHTRTLDRQIYLLISFCSKFFGTENPIVFLGNSRVLIEEELKCDDH